MSPTPQRAPTPTRLLVAAALAPALLALVPLALHLAGRPLATRGLQVFLLLAALAPLLLLVAAWPRLRAAEPALVDARIEHALQAVERAERDVREAFGAVARVEAAAAPARITGSAWLRPAALLGALLLLGGGLAYGFTLVPEERLPPVDPFHIHATFAIHVDGERVNFTDPAFDLAQRGFLISHLHVPEDHVLHIEGKRNQPLGEILERALGVTLEQDALTLDGMVHGGARHANDAEKTLRVYVAHAGSDAWVETADAPAYVPMNGDRILLTYGPDDAERLETEKASVRAYEG